MVKETEREVVQNEEKREKKQAATPASTYFC